MINLNTKNINKISADENYPVTLSPHLRPEICKNEMKFSFAEVIEEDLNLSEPMGGEMRGVSRKEDGNQPQVFFIFIAD